jgi:hypothetical protein
MASEIASVQSKMVLGMDTEMVSELEIPSGMSLESKLIDLAHLFRGYPNCLIGSSSSWFTVLSKTDVIAVLEEC